MTNPFVVSSDWHAHNWDSFNPIRTDGTRDRIHILCDAVKEANDSLLAAGGREHIVTGDIFHTRGKIAASVMNPLRDMLETEIARGIEFIMIPGNHDLETDYALDQSSAVSFLRDNGVTVHSEIYVDNVNRRIFLPWIKDLSELRKQCSLMDQLTEHDFSYSLFMHAPINGVLTGLPHTGLSPAEISDWGFGSVYSGHYHNHKAFYLDNRKVVSVGSLTHQNFGDIDSLAGYILAHDEYNYTFRATSAPKFMTTDPDNLANISGNYVRDYVRGFSAQEQAKRREDLINIGALDAIVNNTPAVKKAERAMEVPVSMTLVQSVAEYCKKCDDDELVIAACVDVLESADEY